MLIPFQTQAIMILLRNSLTVLAMTLYWVPTSIQ